MLDIVNFKDNTLTKKNQVNTEKYNFEYVLINSNKKEILGFGKTKEILFKNKVNNYTVDVRKDIYILNNPFFGG